MYSGLSSLAHYVLLEHNYSVDFPWWFDRKITFFSLLSKTIDKIKLVKWQRFKTALCNLTKNCLRWILSALSLDWDLAQIFKSIWKPNAWKKLYYISFYSIFCRLSCFHREWLANGFLNGKLKLVKIVANWGHSQWKELNLQKIE